MGHWIGLGAIVSCFRWVPINYSFLRNIYQAQLPFHILLASIHVIARKDGFYEASTYFRKETTTDCPGDRVKYKVAKNG